MERGIDTHAISVGSTARNTWIRGDEYRGDIDIFIPFPAHLSEEDLKEKGLALAKSISDRYEERYASHPYIHAYFYDEERGTEHEVDLVPCFSVKNASVLKSAVDRTPFHKEYVVKRIPGLEDEVLLLKQFMKSLGIYGSEQRRKGFTGYLCELLILHYSSFVELLIDASRWKYGKRIDLEGEGTYKGNGDLGKGKGPDPLIVIDPVDPKRNVAASVSEYSFCRLIDAARSFLRDPDINFFLPLDEKLEPLNKAEFMNRMKERGTELVMIVFDAPDVVEDVLFPQLRKAVASITILIEQNGFVVYRSDVHAGGGKAFFLIELLVWTLPRIKKHWGPPVTMRHHSDAFKKKYAATDTKPGDLNRRLFIENGRYVVEVERRYTNVVSLLKNELRTCSLGKQVAESIGSGYEVWGNDEIERQLQLSSDPDHNLDLGKFFREYFCGI